MWRGLPILRDKNSKWFVSYEEIPKQDGYDLYPDDCTGWLWITSPGYEHSISQSVSDDLSCISTGSF